MKEIIKIKPYHLYQKKITWQNIFTSEMIDIHYDDFIEELREYDIDELSWWTSLENNESGLWLVRSVISKKSNIVMSSDVLQWNKL